MHGAMHAMWLQRLQNTEVSLGITILHWTRNTVGFLQINNYADTVMISVARKVFLEKMYLHAASYACGILIASHN